MTNVIQSQKNSTCVSTGDCFPTFSGVVSSIVKETSFLAQSVIEFTADVLFDCGRAVDFSTQWISDYSTCSSNVKETAGRVKNATDRFNLFASACETICAGQALVREPIESISDAINSIGSYVGSSMDLTGRLAGLNIISLGKAQLFVDGAGAIADSLVGLNATREVLQSPEMVTSRTSSLLKVAKNVTLVAFAALAGFAACFASLAASVSQMPLYILTLGSTYLALKVASCFYDKLALPSPLELAVKV